MSLLNVEHLTHGFGDRAIFDDVSFRLLKGEHIGLVGANGEGKSTFMNIITGKLMPDEGRIEWAKNIKVGYLDQHSVLEKGMTIGSVMRQAFDDLFVMEERMNEICDKMMDADDEQMTEYMEELGTIQDMLTNHDFYMIDAKVEEVARALKPEMEKLMAECEARVAATETPALALTHDAPQDNTVSVTDDEAILPSQTFNLLKGLNDD